MFRWREEKEERAYGMLCYATSRRLTTRSNTVVENWHAGAVYIPWPHGFVRIAEGRNLEFAFSTYGFDGVRSDLCSDRTK